MNKKTFLRTAGSLAALLYALSILLTWPAAGVFGSALNRFAGTSLFPATLGGGDMLFLGEFWTNSRAGLAMVPYTLLPLAVVYFLLQIFGSAGVMAAFARPDPEGTLPAFAGGVVRLGPRFLLLFLVMLPAYALCAFIFCLPALVLALVFQDGASETAQIYLGILIAVLAAGGLAAGQVYHYSAKAALTWRATRLWRSLALPWLLGWGYWRRMIPRYLAVILGGGAAAAILTAAAAKLPGAVPAILLLQSGVFVHIAARVALHGLFSGEVSRRLELRYATRGAAEPVSDPVPAIIPPEQTAERIVFPAAPDILHPAEEVEVTNQPPVKPFPGT
jgi:hypothetical protein